MFHGTHMNESRHTYEQVMSHIWMSHVAHMNESCHVAQRLIGRACCRKIQYGQNQWLDSFSPARDNTISHFCTIERRTGSVWAQFSRLQKIRELPDRFRPAQGYEHKRFTPYTGNPIFPYGLSWKIHTDSAWRKSVSQDTCFHRLLTRIVDTI